MAHGVKYAVQVVGYSARVLKKGRQDELAMLDFISGCTSLHSDDGWVGARDRIHLASLVESIPELASELRQTMLHDRQEKEERVQSKIATASWVTLARGEYELHLSRGADVDKFCRQITTCFLEVRDILEQAEKIGTGIKRRPYMEYIDGIAQSGVAAVEYFGLAELVEGRLIFHPDYDVLFIKQPTPDTCTTPS
jgi:hypothetical protein